MPKSKKKQKNKPLKPAMPPVREVLQALAGVLAMGLPYNKKDTCTSCHIKRGARHHRDCIYREAIDMVVEYYHP
jgi:hypothetical protein